MYKDILNYNDMYISFLSFLQCKYLHLKMFTFNVLISHFYM